MEPHSRREWIMGPRDGFLSTMPCLHQASQAQVSRHSSALARLECCPNPWFWTPSSRGRLRLFLSSFLSIGIVGSSLVHELWMCIAQALKAKLTTTAAELTVAVTKSFLADVSENVKSLLDLTLLVQTHFEKVPPLFLALP